MNIFGIGAAGTRLARLLTARGDAVTGMHRGPDQGHRITDTDTGATAVHGDLIETSIDELAAKMAGHDAVVFSVGAHGTGAEMTTLIDGKGLEKAADVYLAGTDLD